MRYISKQEQFWIACSFGREGAAKRLIEAGVDVNWRSYVVRFFLKYYLSSTNAILYMSAPKGNLVFYRWLFEQEQMLMHLIP